MSVKVSIILDQLLFFVLFKLGSNKDFLIFLLAFVRHFIFRYCSPPVGKQLENGIPWSTSILDVEASHNIENVKAKIQVGLN